MLPFTNLSADRTVGLLTDALTEDVTALLARVPGFFVIARSSSFLYRDASHELRRIGDALGVQYLSPEAFAPPINSCASPPSLPNRTDASSGPDATRQSAATP